LALGGQDVGHDDGLFAGCAQPSRLHLEIGHIGHDADGAPFVLGCLRV
jgi:hypothetical protein